MNQRQHAIVVGGSIAGLLAARVLSDHFEHVTLIDRDFLPDSPEPRKGAPQTAHVHVLLRRGMLIMQALFPQLDDDLTQAGALTVNWTRDLVTFTPAGWAPRFDSTFITRTLSRGLLEQLIRRRVAAIQNVTIEPRCEAIEPVSNAGRSVCLGLKVRYRDWAENAVVSLSADLIVDASGRSSHGPEWLAALGYAQLEETVINAHIGYATRVYRRPANLHADWKVMIVHARPPFDPRSGLIYPIENDLWMVNLGGVGDERPPTDDQAFLDYTKTLIHPALYDSIKDAEPVSPVYAYQRTENRLRHFERLTRWPEHFVMLGDAACAFNPIYGQGMTVAALEAQALDKWLRSGQSSLEFEKQIMPVVRGPWLLATNADLRLPGVEGARPGRFDKLVQTYVDGFIRLACRDPQALATFMAVTHLMEPPSAMLRPALARKVLPRLIRKVRSQGIRTDPVPPLPR